MSVTEEQPARRRRSFTAEFKADAVALVVDEDRPAVGQSQPDERCSSAVLAMFGSPDVDCVDGDWSVVRADSQDVKQRDGQPVGGVSTS